MRDQVYLLWLVLQRTDVIPHVRFLLSLLCFDYLIHIFLHGLVVILILAHRFLKTPSVLAHEVPLLLQYFLRNGQLFRLNLLLPLLHHQVKRLRVKNLPNGLFVFGYFRVALFPLLLDLLKVSLVPLKPFLL